MFIYSIKSLFLKTHPTGHGAVKCETHSGRLPRAQTGTEERHSGQRLCKKVILDYSILSGGKTGESNLGISLENFGFSS